MKFATTLSKYALRGFWWEDSLTPSAYSKCKKISRYPMIGKFWILLCSVHSFPALCVGKAIFPHMPYSYCKREGHDLSLVLDPNVPVSKRCFSLKLWLTVALAFLEILYRVIFMRDLVCWSRPAICCFSVAIKSSCSILPPLLCCVRCCRSCSWR